MKKRILIGTLMIPLLFACNNGGTTPSEDPKPGPGPDPVDPSGDKDEPYDLSGDVVKYGFAKNANMVHARYPQNKEAQNQMGNEEEAFGVNWWQEGWEMNDDIESDSVSYARIILNAPFTGEYNMSLQAKEFDKTYPFRVYVNEKTVSKAINVSIDDETYVWATEERSTTNFKVNLKKGKNVVLVQVNNWGGATSFTIPKEVEVVKAKGGLDGAYTKDDFIYQATFLDENVDLFNPESDVKYQPLKYDANYSYEAAAILHFTPKATTASFDVTYKVSAKDNNAAGMTLRLGTNANNSYTFDFSSDNIGVEKTFHIPSYVLDEMGFVANTKTNLRLSSSAGYLDVIKVTESTVSDVEPGGLRTVKVNEIRNNAVINGRNIYDEGSIGLDWTAAGIEFDITGGGNVYANLREVADAFGSINTSAGGTRFAVEIDKVFQGYVRPTTKTVLAEGLSSTKHNIAIYKTSEAAGGLVDLLSLKIDANATINKPQKDYKFEILGDSFTCGNQISTTEENGYLAYASVLARSYNAQANIMSVSGRGLMLGWNLDEGWAASWNNEIKDLWTMTSYFRDRGEMKFNHSDFSPDVVILNIGGNDLGDYVMSIAPLTIEEFAATVTAFGQKLRQTYPNAKIIWGHGYYVNRKYENEYRAAVEACNDPNMDFIYMQQFAGGAQDHANAEEHQTMADIYSAKIASMLGITDPRAH